MTPGTYSAAWQAYVPSPASDLYALFQDSTLNASFTVEYSPSLDKYTGWFGDYTGGSPGPIINGTVATYGPPVIVEFNMGGTVWQITF
jgi:hypothetical protein